MKTIKYELKTLYRFMFTLFKSPYEDIETFQCPKNVRLQKHDKYTKKIHLRENCRSRSNNNLFRKKDKIHFAFFEQQ